MKVLRFNNGHLWWPPFCLASHVTKKEKTLIDSSRLTFYIRKYTEQKKKRNNRPPKIFEFKGKTLIISGLLLYD